MNTEPKAYPDPEPDPQVLLVRGVCGAAMGVAIALAIWVRHGGLGLFASTLVFAACIVGCAWGAIRHGDAFWTDLLRRWL